MSGVEGEVELQDVDAGFADEAEQPSGGVPVDQPSHVGGCHAAGGGDPVHLQTGVGDADVRVEAAAAGGDRVGGDGGPVGCVASDRGDHACAVVVAGRGEFDLDAAVGGDEGPGRAGLVEAHRAGDGAGGAVAVIDGQDGADSFGGAVGAAAVDAFEFADGFAAGADLGEQAGLVRNVDDVLGPEVARRCGCRVVAVAGGGRPGLEVLLERIAVAVGVRLADEPAADGAAVLVGDRAAGSVGQAREPADADHQQRIEDAEQDGQDDQGAQCGEVLGEPGWQSHVRSPEWS